MTLDLSRPLLLDTGPLGQIAHPRRKPEVAAWYGQALAANAALCVPEIADYEARRSFLLEDLSAALRRLDGLRDVLTYLPLTTATMQEAARLWAQARKEGRPTAHPFALDGDVILAAQALSVGGIVVTDNAGHLARFVETRTWQELVF